MPLGNREASKSSEVKRIFLAHSLAPSVSVDSTDSRSVDSLLWDLGSMSVKDLFCHVCAGIVVGKLPYIRCVVATNIQKRAWHEY